MGPVHLVGLADHHFDAVLPDVGLAEPLVVDVVVAALEAAPDVVAGQQIAAAAVAVLVELGTRSELVVLAGGVVLGAEMPVNVDGAHLVLPVRGGDGDVIDLHAALVALGDVAPGLGLHVGDGADDAVIVGKVGLLARAGILALGRLVGAVDLIASVNDDVGRNCAGSGSGIGFGGLGGDGGERGNAGDGHDAAEGEARDEDLVVAQKAGAGGGRGGLGGRLGRGFFVFHV